MKDFYPPIIDNLPIADIPVDGVDARLLQSDKGQLVFFDLPAGKEIPPHSHGEQWGCVLDGELELTIDGNTNIYRKGDTYHIPAGVVHGAKFLTQVKVLDLFADTDRYGVK
jgi:quercetin dioxygenase-like cupin family protein